MKIILVSFLLFQLSYSQNSCGLNCTYSLQSHSLTILGNGAIQDYNEKKPAPWNNFKSTIQTIILGPEIEVIGTYAFSGLTQLQEITGGGKIKSIRDGAFSECTSLKEITIPEYVETIGFDDWEAVGKKLEKLQPLDPSKIEQFNELIYPSGESSPVIKNRIDMEKGKISMKDVDKWLNR